MFRKHMTSTGQHDAHRLLDVGILVPLHLPLAGVLFHLGVILVAT